MLNKREKQYLVTGYLMLLQDNWNQNLAGLFVKITNEYS